MFTSRKLGALALSCIVLMGSFISQGCTKQTATNVAQAIVNFAPAFDSAIVTINQTGALLDPGAAGVFSVATTGFQALEVVVVGQAKTYLANPTDSVMAALQQGVVSLQQTVNTALLQAAGIKDPVSQAKAIAAINGFGALVNTILGLIQQVSNKAELQRMESESTIKFSMVRRYMDTKKMDEIGSVYGVNSTRFFGYEAQQGF